MIYLVRKVVSEEPQSLIYVTTDKEKALNIFNRIKKDFFDNFEWIEVVSIEEDEFNIQSVGINLIETSYTT